MTPFVSGLILAAGGSTRLGQPKQLLPFQSTTLLGWIVARVTATTSLDEVIVVLGGAAAEIRQRVDFRQARVVDNAAYSQGCSSSYRTGIGALDSRAEAVMVLLGDQPLLDSAVIDRVIDAWRQSRAPIVLASYREGDRDRPGHPIVFARPLFERLVALRGDKAAWKIVDAEMGSVRHVHVDRPYPADVNTWQAYEALVRGSAS
jgi:molybdenum cofactor cytidylyltransferase